MLAGCCLLQGGTMGLINNCRGIFLSPVTEAMGFSMGGFTAYIMISGIVACLFTPLASRLLAGSDPRWLLGGMSLLFSFSEAAMGLARSLPAFYVLGAVQGVSAAFLMFLPAPLILGQWFKKRSGFAIGLCSAFSGLIGILFNPIGSVIMERYGWQMGYIVFAFIALCMTFPVSVFLLRVHPWDVGLTPYGGDEEAPEAPLTGIPAEEARRTFSFAMIVAASFLITFLGSFNSHLSPMGISYGYSVRVAAYLISVSMVGNVVSKGLLGVIYDRKGLGTALAVGLSTTAAGCALLLVDSIPVRLLGALLYGFVMGTGNILTALVVKDVYGLRGYGGLLFYISTVISLSAAFSIQLGGWMVDVFGAPRGYQISFAGALVLVAVVSLLYSVAIPRGRKLVRAYDARQKVLS